MCGHGLRRSHESVPQLEGPFKLEPLSRGRGLGGPATLESVSKDERLLQLLRLPLGAPSELLRLRVVAVCLWRARRTRTACTDSHRPTTTASTQREHHTRQCRVHSHTMRSATLGMAISAAATSVKTKRVRRPMKSVTDSQYSLCTQYTTCAQRRTWQCVTRGRLMCICVCG